MALLLTQRFNWMGYEGTESEALNIALLRPGSATEHMRYIDIKTRQEVAAEIRMRLKLIKRDLGLLPIEKPQAEVEEEFEEIDFDSEEDIETGIKSARRSGTCDDASDDYEHVFLHPKPPSDAEVKTAAKSFAAGVRSLLVVRGETYVSYIDGREFISLADLKEHNEKQRPLVAERIDGTGVNIPPHVEFDTEAIEAALEEKNQCRMKYDAVRCINDPSHAAKLPAEERDGAGNPVTNVSPEDGDEQSLLEKLNSAQAKLTRARAAYNKKATQSAMLIHSALVSKEEEREL